MKYLRNYDEGEVPLTYQTEIDNMKNWIDGRLAWIDNNIGNVYYPVEIISSLDENLAIRDIGNTIKIFPNPAQNELHVQWEKGFNAVQLLSIDGKIILEERFPGLRQHIRLDLNFEAGLYFMIISNEGGRTVHKLLIE